MFDVAVDLRPGSPTYRRWTAAELSADNARASSSPRGSPTASSPWTAPPTSSTRSPEGYAAEAGVGYRWDDPAFGIAWPAADGERLTISDRDRSWPLVSDRRR